MDSTQLKPWLLLKYIEIFISTILFFARASLFLGLISGKYYYDVIHNQDSIVLFF